MTESLSGKRILVTGATGFIGGHLARRLHAEGAHVLALEHTPGRGDALAASGIEVVRGDVTDKTHMEGVISQDVQIVMHIAAWLRGRPLSNYQTVNVQATRYLAELGAAAGVSRFVYTSSVSVYGLHGDTNVDESTPLRPYGDPYGDSKIHAEEALHEIERSTGLPCVIVRPGMVYGPGSPGWTKRLARWARQGQLPLIDSGRGTAYPVYIDNLADLFVLCAAHPAAVGETFNAVDDGPVTFAEFMGGYMAMIPTNRAIRLPGWVVRAAMTLIDPFVPGFKLIYIADQLIGRGLVLNQKAKDRLGWSPKVSLKEGLVNSEVWLRSKGIL